jgi:O-antigen ligase
MKNILENFSILNLSSILLVFIPVFLITGPLLPDLSVVIIVFSFLFYVIKSNKIEIFKNVFFLYFIGFYILLVISSIFSDYTLYSLKSSIPYIRFGLFSLGTWILFKYKTNNIIYLCKIFSLIILLLFIDSVTQFISGKNLLGWEYNNPQNFRITSLFGKDEVLGSYVARFFPFYVSLVLFCKKELNYKFNDYLFYLILIASFLICLISGERTSFALMILSVFLIFITCLSLRKVFFFGIVIAIIISTLIISFDKRMKDRMVNNVIDQMGLSSSSERIVIFSKTYEGHYQISLNMFKEKPLLGHGVKSFRKYCEKPENYVAENACTTHSHNIYMQLLAETGLLGFSLIFGLFVILVLKLIRISYLSFFNKNYKIDDYKTTIYIFYAVNLFPLFPSGNFFNNWLSIIYYLPAGYFIYLNNYKK